ncbi:tyrosine-type recombinase/integrase [Thiocapsa bogorovii]|uniref:tyrosine-type recombinase/integrase n=1 Tax=Thiocapsa bogorovii TaxID=521689 RepID=UPI001E2E5A21|nr:site-specific integrase [Thiocapsa bogorovii]UHD16320.1 site-specific integrase [Thiocapsa bogorovii]
MPRKRKQDQDGLYRRSDSQKWWASYTDASGQRVRCSTGTSDRQEADALLAKWKLETHRQRQWGEQPKRSFEELMVVYLNATARHKRSAETDKYRVIALRGHFSGRIMQELGPADVRGYVERRREQGVSDTTINRDLALLSAAIGYANVELEWMLPNPVAGRKLAEPEGRVRWITREESVALIAAAGRAPRAPFMADLITVALYTGCRRGELLGLDWARVDLKQNLIHLEGRHTKSGKRRSVPLCETARAAILRRARFRAEHCPDSQWVFAYRDGHQAKDIRGAFYSACRAANLADFTFHDLRHTCAAWLVTGGAPLAEIRDLLGHSTIMMTERYAHLAPENLRTTVGRLDMSRFSHAPDEATELARIG